MVIAAEPLRCHRCRGTTNIIDRDGPPVCYGCVLLLGHVVRDPEHGSDTLLGVLDELHADVVHLRSEDGVLSWRWTADWPAAGASR